MKQIIINLFIFFLIINSYSQKKITDNQTTNIPCGSDYLYEKNIKENPSVIYELEELEKLYKKEYSKQAFMKSGSNNITIPVVFYVVHDGGASNIPDSQVQAQLAVLNNYFVGFNVNFCLATKLGTSTTLPTVSGSVQTTPGIIHVLNSSIANHNINTTANQQALISGSTNFNITPDKFLRIWIVKDILDNNQPTGILGYSPVPLTASVLDGIVIKYNVVGNNQNCPNCLSNYSEGKTLIHEVGHYLGLFHTFHEGCLGSESSTCMDSGDKVCDTPQSATPIANCNTTINSCTENIDNDDLSNFMSYTIDSCKDHFTQGQADRMFAVLNNFRPFLFSTENLVDVGSCSSNLISSVITPSSYLSCSNNTITFSSPYTNTTTYSYNWNFGDPLSPNNTASTPSANHIYQSALGSPYTVTLTITRNSDGVSSTSTKKIYITNCQPIQNSQGTWIVSQSNLLRFNTGVPVFDANFPTNPNQSLIYSLANQSDNNGNLLFYTNKVSVHNSSYNIINLNNTTIADDINSGRALSSIILPKPNDPNKYYIFSNTIKGSQQAFNSSHGFRFSEIQVNSGNAIMNSIRQPIFDSSMSSFFQTQLGAFYNGEGITAIKKNSTINDESYWIITTLKGVDNNSYVVVFLFDDTNTVKYHSHFLSPINIQDNYLTLESSPNGNKIFLFNSAYLSNAYILDFNKATGIITNPKMIFHDFSFISGASFSPNSNLLYFTEGQRRLYQVNLNSTNPGQTKIQIISENFPRSLTQMQMGPDGKIYIDGYSTDCLKVIHNPNNLCTTDNYNNCNYYYYGPKKAAAGVTYLAEGLPNNIDAQKSSAYTNNTNSISYYLEGCNTFKFFPDYYGQNFSWDFGDTASGINNTSTSANPTHTFTVGNNPQYIFTVTLKNSSGIVIAQKQIIINNTVNTITGSNSACSNSSTNATNNYINLLQGQSVVWSITNGSGTIQNTNSQQNVLVNWSQLPGTLSAIVTNEFGCQKTINIQISENCCSENLIFNSVENNLNTTYNASNSITTQTNYQLNSGFTSTLKSGNTIVIKANSHIKNGAVFLAILEDCNGNQLVDRSETIVSKPNYYNTSNNPFNYQEENDSKSDIDGLKMYPNPTKNNLFIETTLNGDINVSIVNMLGREVINTKVVNNTVNVANLTSGIYIVKITEEGKTSTKKLIIE